MYNFARNKKTNPVMKKLNRATVEKKDYPFKILQYGEGNFLRAFVDWMIDGANRRGVMSHGIAAVHPIPGGERIEEMFREQDCLYHVVLEGVKDKKPVREITLVESLAGVINPYREYARYEELFLSRELEIIVSNTTEAGIRWEEGDDIHALPPASFPAKMTALLYKRWRKFGGDLGKGLCVVCCELIENNGSTLREYVLRHTFRLVHPDDEDRDQFPPCGVQVGLDRLQRRPTSGKPHRGRSFGRPHRPRHRHLQRSPPETRTRRLQRTCNI
jgi:mannitol-1-phosphate/altronate dehydrogenase